MGLRKHLSSINSDVKIVSNRDLGYPLELSVMDICPHFCGMRPDVHGFSPRPNMLPACFTSAPQRPASSNPSFIAKEKKDHIPRDVVLLWRRRRDLNCLFPALF